VFNTIPRSTRYYFFRVIGTLSHGTGTPIDIRQQIRLCHPSYFRLNSGRYVNLTIELRSDGTFFCGYIVYFLSPAINGQDRNIADQVQVTGRWRLWPDGRIEL